MWQVAIAMMLGQAAGQPVEPQLPPLAPADAIAAIHADLAGMPAELRTQVRYFSAYNAPLAERFKIRQVFNGHVNHLSRKPALAPVTVVPGSQASLVRVVMRDYGWTAATFDKLRDPYFSVEVETSYEDPWPGGVWPDDGKYYKANTFTVRRVIKSPAIAPWLSETPENKAKLADIVNWTQARVVVARWDWFTDQTSAAEDRPVNYHDFLGFKNEKEFQEMVGVDPKLAERFAAVNRDAVSISGITKHDRAIDALGKIRGTYFKTRDHAKPKAGTALRVLGKEGENTFDASEQIAALPNKLLAFGLFDNKGVRTDKAPDNIVRSRVDIYRSCLDCHVDRGLHDVASWIQPLVKGPLNLLSPDYDTALKLREEYYDGLDQLLEDERVKYDRRVKEITGMTYREWSGELIKGIRKYEDGAVTLEVAAADLGTTPDKWRAALDRQAKANLGNTVLAPMLNKGSISRSVWETEYPNAQLALKGYAQ